MEIIVILLIALFIYLLQGFIYKNFWHKGLNLSLRFERESAFEGERLDLIEVLSNHKLLPLPWLTVKYQIPRRLVFDDSNNTQTTDFYYRNDLFSISMRQRVTRKLPFLCSKRGYYTIKSVDFITSNLLGTEKFVSREPAATYLTVYPGFADLSGFEIPFGRITGSIITRNILNPDPFSFRGIREYLPTDTLRQVNFKASARMGSLMSNEYSQTLSQEIVLVLNLEKVREWYHHDLVFEYSIRLAASVTDFAVRNEMPIRLRTNGCDLLTGVPAVLPAGSGDTQLYLILELLARIDLAEDCSEKGSVLLSRSLLENDRESVYILISPYYEQDIQEMFARCAEEAFDSLWLLPYLDDELDALALSSESILPYEVVP